MGFDTSKTLFNKETQDRMADYYLNYAGYKEWKAGEISDQEFNDRLAGQFASIKKVSGVGAYDDDGMNKAYGDIMPLLKQLREGEKYKGLQSSLEADKVNQIAALTPEGYMSYDTPVTNSQPNIAFAVTQPVENNAATIGNGGNGEIAIQHVTDNGAVLSLMQLHSLAVT